MRGLSRRRQQVNNNVSLFDSGDFKTLISFPLPHAGGHVSRPAGHPLPPPLPAVLSRLQPGERSSDPKGVLSGPFNFPFFPKVYWLSFLYGTCSNCDAPVYTAGVPQACTSGPAPLPGEEESSSSYSESSSSPPTLLEQGFIV